MRPALQSLSAYLRGEEGERCEMRRVRTEFWYV
jgi:hypothetical protein